MDVVVLVLQWACGAFLVWGGILAVTHQFSKPEPKPDAVVEAAAKVERHAAATRATA